MVAKCRVRVRLDNIRYFVAVCIEGPVVGGFGLRVMFLLGLSHQLAKTHPFALPRCAEFGIRAIASGEVRSVFLAQRTYQGIAALFANLPGLWRIPVSLTVVETLGKVLT
jgi:hypothetical protein